VGPQSLLIFIRRAFGLISKGPWGLGCSLSKWRKRDSGKVLLSDLGSSTPVSNGARARAKMQLATLVLN
jgi:hypothetical protein